MALDASAAAAPDSPASRSIVTSSGSGFDGRPAGRPGIDQGHDVPGAHVTEPVREEPLDEIGRRIVGRRRPDVRLTTERGEQDEDLGQPTIERRRLVRPADRLEPVPERFRFHGIVEQDAVPEVAQVATRDRVDPRLVEQQASHGRRVDR